MMEGGRYATVSAKIPKRVKELMKKYEIKPGPIIREILEEKVKEKVLEELEKRARKLKKRLENISDEEIVDLIREDRGR